MGTPAKKITRFWPVVLIFLLWLTFGAPFFFHGRIPFPSTYLVTFFPPWNAYYGMPVKNNAMPDVISQIYPWKLLTIDTWKNGQIPLWNPYSFSGTPHAANYQSAVFSPFNLLFFILPFIDAWSFLILLQPLIAGLGTYFLLRRLSRSREAAVIGAIAFMFCGFVTTWMAYGTLGYAIVFLPWALWAVATDFIKKSRLSRIVITLSIFLSFVAGHFQISIYLFGAIIGFIIFQSLTRREYRHGGTLLIYSFLGLAVAAPQLLVTLDAYRASTRGLSFSKIEVIPWKYIITSLAPDFYGNPVTRNDWFGHYAEWSSYVGVVPFVLAMFAAWRNFVGEKRYFILLGIIALLFAYPTPLNDLLFNLRIPAISTSAASRIIVLFSFSLAVLSAYGLDELITYWKKEKYAYGTIFSIACVTLLAVIWVLLLIGHVLPSDHLIIAKRNFVLPTGIAVISLFLLMLGLVRKQYVRQIVIVILIFITLFDSYRFVTKWMPFESREFLYPPIKSVTFLASRIGHDRVFGNIGNEVGSVFHLPLIEGYDAVYQGRYAEFINASSTGKVTPGGRSVVQFDKQGLYKTDVLELLGVKFIYQRISDGKNIWAFPYWEYLGDSSMKQVYNDGIYQIFEFTYSYPRAFLASSYVVEKKDQTIIDTLFAPTFDRRNTLVLEQQPAFEPKEGSGSARILAYMPDSVTIQTVADIPKLLFLSDVFDPGWHATIDGKEVNIGRADYDFRSVAVPAGQHTVQFTYFPLSLQVGLWISSLACMAGIGMLLLKI